MLPKLIEIDSAVTPLPLQYENAFRFQFGFTASRVYIVGVFVVTIQNAPYFSLNGQDDLALVAAFPAWRIDLPIRTNEIWVRATIPQSQKIAIMAFPFGSAMNNKRSQRK